MIVTCRLCGEKVLRLRHTTEGYYKLVDPVASARGTLVVNEMLGTFMGIARPGPMHLRTDLRRLHSETCSKGLGGSPKGLVDKTIGRDKEQERRDRG